MAKKKSTKKTTTDRRGEHPTSLDDPLPSVGQYVSIEIMNLTPWVTYCQDGQPVWRYLVQAIQQRRRTHHITMCQSANDAQKHVANWQWHRSGRILSATLKNPSIE